MWLSRALAALYARRETVLLERGGAVSAAHNQLRAADTDPVGQGDFDQLWRQCWCSSSAGAAGSNVVLDVVLQTVRVRAAEARMESSAAEVLQAQGMSWQPCGSGGIQRSGQFWSGWQGLESSVLSCKLGQQSRLTAQISE